MKQANGQPNGDKRKYPSQRPLFDRAVKESKFSEAFSKLAEGSLNAGDAAGIISDLNSCRDRAAYSTEIIGIRRTFRDLLPKIGYNEEVDKFLADAAAMIGSVSEPLGNEIIFGLSKAAQNENYLEAVDKAISSLHIKRLESLKQTVRKRMQWKLEAEIAAARAAELAERALEPLAGDPPEPRNDSRIEAQSAARTAEAFVERLATDETPETVAERPAEISERVAEKPPESEGQAETRKVGYWALAAAGIAIAGIVAAAVYSQKDDVNTKTQKAPAAEPLGQYEGVQRYEPELGEEQELHPAPAPAVEERKAEPPPEPEPKITKKPVSKPTRREILMQKLDRISPGNEDEAKKEAEEFARAIEYSRPNDAVEIVGRLGSIASESPDAGLGSKKRFAISALRHVAVTGDDKIAVEAIEELGRIASTESEVVPVLEGLGANEAIQGSEPRREALRKALAETQQNETR